MTEEEIADQLVWVKAWEGFTTYQQLMIVAHLIGTVEGHDRDMTGQEVVDYFYNILFSAQITLEGKNKK